MLAIAPTRELALQVAAELEWLYAEAGAKIVTCVGGMDARKEARALNYGAHVVVGPPGRLKDHIDRGALDLSAARVVVLDEADEMLRMGFIDDVEWILDQLPEERQVVLFSATMPNEIRRLSKRYLREPAEITIKTKDKEARRIRHRCITMQNSHKLEALNRVLEAVTGEGVIIFARTKAITLTVAESLEAAGHDVATS